MPTGNLSVSELQSKADKGEIDTVLTVIVDMQGRLMGKRCHVSHFLKHAIDESHFCNYLIATDLNMTPVKGYASTSWAQGYGDYVAKPDLDTLRLSPWDDDKATAVVMCDLYDPASDLPVAHSPRHVLRTQCDTLRSKYNLVAMCATELEFFVFRGSYDELRRANYADLTPYSGVNQDYHILQTSKEEFFMRPVRNGLVAANVPVETSKGEAELGQHELNIRYASAMDCAEHHVLAKHAVKEIAHAKGVAATFLPKWSADKVGSSSHVHLSLAHWDARSSEVPGGTASFDAEDETFFGMSETMRHFVAGMVAYAPEYTAFLAPYVNSYKRFAKGTFAPTRAVWSVDNRTGGFRLCGARTKSVRIECRVAGSDANPYLALSALIAAGMKGLEDKMPLGPPSVGDAYDSECANAIPRTLRDATLTFKTSKFLRDAFGDDVIDHYTRALEWEQADFDRVVTDYEIRRGFELA